MFYVFILLWLSSRDVTRLGEVRRKEESFTTLQSGRLLYHSEANNGQAGIGFPVNKKWKDNITRVSSGSSRVAELILRITDRYQLKIVQVYAPTTSHSDEETDNFYNTIDKILEKETHYTIVMGDLMRKLEDKQIHQKGRQNASAWSSEMKEETKHCLILYRHLILPDLSSKMRPCGGKRCTEEEALLYFIIIYNLASTHHPIQPLSFSFPNFMVAHGVGVAQAKPACKHTIATRKCYQYNTISSYYVIHAYCVMFAVLCVGGVDVYSVGSPLFVCRC